MVAEDGGVMTLSAPHLLLLLLLLLLLCRLAAAGWQDCQLLTEQQLSAKYGVEHAQPILIGNV
jgi:hypothetical protein